MIYPERELIIAIEKYVAQTDLTQHELWEIEVTIKCLERKLADRVNNG